MRRDKTHKICANHYRKYLSDGLGIAGLGRPWGCKRTLMNFSKDNLGASSYNIMAKYGFTVLHRCQVNKNGVTSSTMHTSLLWVKSCMHCIYICTVTPEMNLLPSVGSDKAWVYSVNADFADEEPKVEQLAIRFKNAESEFRCNLLPVQYFTQIQDPNIIILTACSRL